MNGLSEPSFFQLVRLWRVCSAEPFFSSSQSQNKQSQIHYTIAWMSVEIERLVHPPKRPTYQITALKTQKHAIQEKPSSLARIHKLSYPACMSKSSSLARIHKPSYSARMSKPSSSTYIHKSSYSTRMSKPTSRAHHNCDETLMKMPSAKPAKIYKPNFWFA